MNPISERKMGPKWVQDSFTLGHTFKFRSAIIRIVSLWLGLGLWIGLGLGIGCHVMFGLRVSGLRVSGLRVLGLEYWIRVMGLECKKV